MSKKAADPDTQLIETEPPFVKLYALNLIQVHGLSRTQHKILLFMLSKMNSHNEVIYHSRHMLQFCSDNDMSRYTYRNNVKGLVESGLVQKVGQNEYLFNPRYAAKTDWSKVKSIKWEREYTPAGTVDTVKINNKELPY